MYKRVEAVEIPEELDLTKLPRHVAIIMDGNGRWAVRRGQPRVFGHRSGVDSLRRVVEASVQVGLPYLTVFAFSTENWKRPQEEVNALMELLVAYLRSEINSLQEQRIKLQAIGELDALPERARQELAAVIAATRNNRGLILTIGLNYGGRAEIVRAARQLAADAVARRIRPEDITEEVFPAYLYTSQFPDPDLIIRPAGEWRLSNFLLWQAAYSELWVTNTLWPDFSPSEFYAALIAYQGRQRRFGGL